jgi:hypothetical protein
LVKGGPLPPDETVSTKVNPPLLSTTKDCIVPTVSSLTALDGKNKTRHALKQEKGSLENTRILRMRSYPRRVKSSMILLSQKQRRCIQIEDVGCNEC